MSARLNWRALDEAGKARTAANRPASLVQTPAFFDLNAFFALQSASGAIKSPRPGAENGDSGT